MDKCINKLSSSIVSRYSMNIIVFVGLLLFMKNDLCRSAFYARDILPLWTWECVDGKCMPQKAENVSISELQSLTSCNMLCAMQIWPQPTGSVNLSSTAVPVRADLFHLHIIAAPSESVHKHLEDAFSIFRQDLGILQNQARGLNEWHSVTVRILVALDGDPRMRQNTNESYALAVRPIPGVQVTLMADVMAHSFCGARHALETLLQLIWLDTYTGSLMMLDTARVLDAPRFRYRGLLIDTAHNYFPIEELMVNIDAMAASKLNTFHWHISNSQAFPLEIKSVPQMGLYGAQSPGDMYTSDEIRGLVRRARLRGIRVLIEIDAPAHVGYAWNFGPSADLVYCLNNSPWTNYCSEPPCGQLNPHNHNVYDILTRLYTEIMELTGVDDVLHLGGSHISDSCWNDHFKGINSSILWLEFTNSILERLENISGTGTLPNLTIFWSSPLSSLFKSDLKKYIKCIGIQIHDAGWVKRSFPGVRSIISHEDAWDINTGQGEWFEESNGVEYNPWQKIYEHRPWMKHFAGIVEGGEATVWSSVLGEGNLIQHVWPRAAALAERLWTDRLEGATHSVQARIDVHRSRLVARGIQASPIFSMWCTQNPHSCV